jgi:hypothetical protein
MFSLKTLKAALSFYSMKIMMEYPFKKGYKTAFREHHKAAFEHYNGILSLLHRLFYNTSRCCAAKKSF